jgi:hypothetical protein
VSRPDYVSQSLMEHVTNDLKTLQADPRSRHAILDQRRKVHSIVYETVQSLRRAPKKTKHRLTGLLVPIRRLLFTLYPNNKTKRQAEDSKKNHFCLVSAHSVRTRWTPETAGDDVDIEFRISKVEEDLTVEFHLNPTKHHKYQARSVARPDKYFPTKLLIALNAVDIVAATVELFVSSRAPTAPTPTTTTMPTSLAVVLYIISKRT